MRCRSKSVSRTSSLIPPNIRALASFAELRTQWLALLRAQRSPDAQAIAVRVFDAEHAHAPGHVGRLRGERPAVRFDALRDRIDVLGGIERNREALALCALPTSATVILVEKDPRCARTHGGCSWFPFAFPDVVHGESEDVSVEGDALRQ